MYGAIDAPTYWPKEPLAYVEWYTPLASTADEDHKMYQVKKAPFRRGGSPPVEVPIAWTSGTVLDHCSKFWLNSWSSKYSYQSLW